MAGEDIFLAAPRGLGRPPSPDRATILASLCDYVEQIRAEGLEGLPTSAATRSRPPATPVAQAARSQTTAQPPAPAAAVPASAADALYFGRSSQTRPPPVEKYPGLAKTVDLATLREFIGDCDRCKLAPLRTNLVFGVGDPNAQLMFIGEGPGADEDARGEPLVGRAGQLLTDIIERGMGLTRAQVYICNVIK